MKNAVSLRVFATDALHSGKLAGGATNLGTLLLKRFGECVVTESCEQFREVVGHLLQILTAVGALAPANICGKKECVLCITVASRSRI